ncbi:MAG: MFS transporter [Lentisphaerae bacterium]|nr:MFS transporter [Lentisphaerota bacterium]
MTDRMSSGVLPRLAAMMFLQFFVWGCWFATVGNFMTRAGMGSAIFWAYTVGPIAAFVAPFFLGMIADRFFPTQAVLATLHFAGAAAILLAPMAVPAEPGGSPLAFILLLQLHNLCYMPTIGLANTLAFRNLTNQEKQFPVIRTFGTFGWIAAGVLVSKVLKADETDLPMKVAAAAGLLMGLYSLSLPHTPPPAKGKAFAWRDAMGADALQLLRNPSFAVFLVASLLICIPLSAYFAYAPVYLAATGFENPGFSLTYGQMSEVFFLLAMPLIFARLGVKKMILVGVLAWAVRYGLFAAGATASVAWMILGGILLHGICYDFFFVTGYIYTDKVAPEGIRAQAQGLVVLATLGLGMLIGAQVAGALFNGIVKAAAGTPEQLAQWRTFWIIPAVLAAVVMVLFGLFFREEPAKA